MTILGKVVGVCAIICLGTLFAQNIQILDNGTDPAVVGIYTVRADINGYDAWEKPGTPTLYIYRRRITTFNPDRCNWRISTDVNGGGSDATTYYYTGTGSGFCTTRPANFLQVGGLATSSTTPFLQDTSLPVELSSFTVEIGINGVLCRWTTESEIENLGFILERKTNGTEWTDIVSYKSDNNLLGRGTISSPTDYEYLDNLVNANTTYEYRLADIDYDGVVTYHTVRTVKVDKAPLSSNLEEFTVMSAYPNPFNPTTTITYGLEIDSKVNISIYDITGQLITTLSNENQTRGWHSIVWNGTDTNNNQVPAGTYLTKITSNDQTKTVKLMLLK